MIIIKCKCGKVLSYNIERGCIDIISIEPCSCSVEKQLMKKYGLKTAAKIYALGREDGKMALEYEQRRRSTLYI